MFARDDTDDSAYFRRRAEQEHAIADNCMDRAAAFAQRAMAREYERRCGVLTVEVFLVKN